jgi:hypothetical protein
MVNFTAHFDASGNSDRRVVTVAGFVSRLGKWEKFQMEWVSILKTANSRVSMFHMTDFVTSVKGWEEWKTGKSADRAKLISDLTACIQRHTNKGFACTIQVANWKRANLEYKIDEELGNPYGVAAIGCLGGLKQWAARKKIDFRDIVVLFEDGDRGQGDMIARVRTEGFNAIPQSKAQIRAFDACDLAAWKAKTLIDDTYERMLWQANPEYSDRIMASLGQLAKIVQNDTHTRMSYEGLIATCQSPDRPISLR